ncbi:hypothetical protein F53441_7671 [Fusarium austroafricanum]|uniref:DUF6594 domain-containing protein n=1 Tax=Fusarium austroafricanum TaxID=2364996 RepID=A0A8H4KFT8_9HYPO|nr:hypothetical protein F53441_7671 [Fusarium austroafricanum]
MTDPVVLPMGDLRPSRGEDQSDTDTTNSSDGSPQGYHRLAGIMSEDKNLAIFRRFEDINIMQIMALQAEIVELQYRFQVKRKEDEEKGKAYSGSFHALRQTVYETSSIRSGSQDSANSLGHSQYDLLNQLRPKIVEYNSLILQMSELSKVKAPQRSQLENLQTWLIHPKGGNNFLPLRGGIELYTWKPEDTSEYFSLRNPIEDSDPFTKFIMEVLVSIFHPLFGERMKVGKVVDVESGLISYSDSKIVLASNLFAVVVSSALPVLTIFVLNYLKTTTARIGFTVLFTVIFAVILQCFSNAKRIEIFAATATFAAVEVVFIGSALSSK